jgi:signal transduction histidine kinase
VVATLLQQAEITGNPTVSPGFFLNDDPDARTVVVVAVPVFFESEETEDTEDALLTEIRGFAVGVFYVGELVERALANLRPGGIDLDFYQHRPKGRGRLIHRHLSRLRDTSISTVEPPRSDLRFAEQILFGNQRWQVVSRPAPGRFTIEARNSWIILAGGIAFTALLAVYVATLIGRERQVRQEVDVRTSQLWETVQDLNREVAVRKSAEQELQSLNETLEHHIANRTAEANRRAQYLEQFAYVTSHDLKAPLRAVSNLAGWIEEDLADKLDEASREQLALLRDRVKRMHNLIEGLLEYSRVGKTSGSEGNVDTHELISEIIDSLSPPTGFKIKVSGDMPALYVDRLQLGQVFSNLISNALRHHGGAKGKIWIACERFPDGCEFSVCDNGQGIDPAYHNKIFMMFQTLASGDFENSTGIGLALVKKIVEENGGIIRLESEVGKGACFYFTWPTKRPAEKSAGDIQ